MDDFTAMPRRTQRQTSELLDAPPPSDQEAERVVIGSVLAKPDWCSGALGLPVDVFGEYRHRAIWEAVLTLAARGEPIDAGAVGLELARRNRLDVVGTSYLLGLQWEGQPGYIEHFAQRVARAAAQREAVAVACDLLQAAHAGDARRIAAAGERAGGLAEQMETSRRVRKRLRLEGTPK